MGGSAHDNKKCRRLVILHLGCIFAAGGNRTVQNIHPLRHGRSRWICHYGFVIVTQTQRQLVCAAEQCGTAVDGVLLGATMRHDNRLWHHRHVAVHGSVGMACPHGVSHRTLLRREYTPQPCLLLAWRWCLTWLFAQGRLDGHVFKPRSP